MKPLQRLALSQHGVLSLLQASELGFGRRQWRALMRDGVLEEVFPDVARAFGSAPSALGTIRAATLAAGPGALASHRSAATVWGAPCAGIDPVDSIIPGGTRSRSVSGLRLHRSRDLADLEPIIWRGIPTSRPPRLLCDLGAVAPGAVAPVLSHFLTSGVMTPNGVGQALERHRTKGRAGVRVLEQALRDVAIGAKPPDSVLESAMARLLRAHHLPPFEFHAVIAGWEVDFLISGTCLVVETDGWTTHGLERSQFERDRAKDALLREAGYIVQRFTWHQVTRQGAWVAARVRGALARWAPELLAS